MATLYNYIMKLENVSITRSIELIIAQGEIVEVLADDSDVKVTADVFKKGTILSLALYLDNLSNEEYVMAVIGGQEAQERLMQKYFELYPNGKDGLLELTENYNEPCLT